MYTTYLVLLVGQPHPLDVEDDEEPLVEGGWVDPQRVIYRGSN